jgi:hypothetical protein
MKNDNAFARARAMFAAISALITDGLKGLALQQGIKALGPYESRGKGKGGGRGTKRSAAMRRGSGKAYPMNGAREVARRQRQIAAGTLKIS